MSTSALLSQKKKIKNHEVFFTNSPFTVMFKKICPNSLLLTQFFGS